MKQGKAPGKGLRHKVNDGEWIGEISASYGFADWQLVWEHPENYALRKLRKEDPFTLAKGDKIFIPALAAVEVAAATEQTHRFRRKRAKTRLRICIYDLENQPAKNAKFNMAVYMEGSPFPTLEKDDLTTDNKGMVDQLIPAGAGRVKLTFPDLKYEINANLSCLEPLNIEDDKKKLTHGVQQRLSAIGFDPGPVDGKDGPLTQAAVRLFQKFCKDNCMGSFGLQNQRRRCRQATGQGRRRFGQPGK
ncbi:peptidoglycan-binding domain-containing protein [Desulfosarcina ovata]|uniref:peptidoglycan-binding domain-containing protein n=1 Tax=Desulfosarcina ovata TaxID=83564 RepID=UPI0018D62701|nr:peptidoglycan-binding domain-containing protein [Desulfosarcina ovata]